MIRAGGFGVVACALSAWVVVTSVALGGNLNPPPGPITPTDRSILSQATTPPPYTISSPGSYKLTSDLVNPGSTTAIFVTANDVTLDLNGFSIKGQGLQGSGVLVSGDRVVIRNGVISGFDGPLGGGFGIQGQIGGTFVVVEDVTVHDCFQGIVLDRGRVTRCEVQEIKGSGILMSHAGLVERCTVEHVGLAGVSGEAAIGGANGSKIIDCVVTTASTFGVNADSGTLVQGCTASGGASRGFQGTGGSTLRECSASGCGEGIAVADSEAVECTVSGSTGHGIEALQNSVVDRCTVIGSQGSGIAVYDVATVTNNRCWNNATVSGAGIETFGFVNVIAHNSVRGNLGSNFLISSASNTVYGNIATGLGASNYTIANPAFNDVATITTAAASTNANDNLSY